MQRLNKNSTLTEILDYICEPNEMESRVCRFKEQYSNLKFFKTYIDLCFFDKGNFDDFDDYEFITKVKARAINSFITTTNTLFYRYIPVFMNNSAYKKSYKHSMMTSLLEEISREDVYLVLGMVKGKCVYHDTKINQLFLSKVFEEKKS